MNFTEIYPTGFSSWTAYYRHKEKVEKNQVLDAGHLR